MAGEILAFMSYHSPKAFQVLKEFSSDKQGLGSAEAGERLKKYGQNKLPEKKRFSSLRIFINQFKSSLVIILLVAGAITLFLNRPTDSLVIWTALLVNAVVGFVQEKKASDTLSSLRRMLTVRSIVMRDGHKTEIPQEEVVPGDIILLEAGDKVPADARLIESHDLEVDQSSLTGEWEPVLKQVSTLSSETPLADRKNMVHAGTSVEDGRGKAVVVATGADTQFGQIATSVREIEEEKTPYQRRVARFSKKVGIFLMIGSAFIFIFGWLIRGGDPLQMFEVAVAVAVSSIPEGLPVAIIVILALGMQRISQKKGLVKKLASAETLGSTSIICADKTGTLTEARMEVAGFYGLSQEITPENDNYQRALQVIGLDNEAFIEYGEDGEMVIRGDSTEKALRAFAAESEFSTEQWTSDHQRIREIPFRTEQKFSASVFEQKSGAIVLSKGAPSVLIDRSTHILLNGERKKLDPTLRNKLKAGDDELGRKGYRVLGLADRSLQSSPTREQSSDDIVSNLTFLGFVALEDPIRPEAKEAIAQCQKAGIKPIIITGDSKVTAQGIARELDLSIGKDEILSGQELKQISDEEMDDLLTKVKIYARVEPIQKLRIVEAWKANHEVVAMTGDGVNDAPALQEADVGIALNSGTDVAKEAADLVLMEDNFPIILAAVEEGRAILDNIRKVITYLLSDSFTELLLIGVSFIMGWPLPLLAAQILWVNLIEDSVPSIALSFEPKEDNLLQEKPRSVKAPLLNKEMKVIIFIIGLVTDLLLLGVFYYLYQNGSFPLAKIRTIIFAALSMDSLFYLFSCKNLKKSIWEVDFLSNKFLLIAWWAVIALVLLGIYQPFLQHVLGTVSLGLPAWIIIGALALVEAIGIEAAKWFFIHRKDN